MKSDEYNNDSGDVDDGDDVRDLECVICLSALGDGQIGRSLPKCGHRFTMAETERRGNQRERERERNQREIYFVFFGKFT